MSALLCRAVTDVKRIWQLRDSKQALNILVQKGSLGDETVARFAAAEKELEAEVVDVVAEANTFKQGWGQWIFASASEIAQREKIKSVLEGLPKIKQEQGEIQYCPSGEDTRADLGHHRSDIRVAQGNPRVVIGTRSGNRPNAYHQFRKPVYDYRSGIIHRGPAQTSRGERRPGCTRGRSQFGRIDPGTRINAVQGWSDVWKGTSTGVFRLGHR